VTRATWLGHSTVLVETAGATILTDPVLGDGIGPVRRRVGPLAASLADPQGVVISHLHHDHFDMASLDRLPRDTVIVVPRRAGRLLRSRRFADVREVEAGELTEIGSVRVEAVPARHSGWRLPFGPFAAALGYVIHGEHRMYFAGDTDLFDGMAAFAPELDLAILPVGGWGPTLRGGHMDPARAAAALRLLRPEHAFAVHWGTLWPAGMSRVRRERFEEPGRRFVEAAHAATPEVHVHLLDPGDVLVLPTPGPEARQGNI